MKIHGMEPTVLHLFQGRVPLLVADCDGDTHVHFVALAPKGMTLDDAMKTVTAAHAAAVDADPDEWNYDDVETRLRQARFDMFGVYVWEEGIESMAVYPDDEEDDDEEEDDEGEEAGQAASEAGPAP